MAILAALCPRRAAFSFERADPGSVLSIHVRVAPSKAGLLSACRSVPSLALRVRSQIEAVREAARPYVHLAAEHSMSILRHVDDSTVSANDIMTSAQALAESALPALQRALNQSTAMLARVERISQNPVVQLRLGASD